MQQSSNHQNREHSVKVPRLYKVATSILKSFKNGEGSVKTLVYDSRKKHPNIKALFALVTECLKYETAIEEAFVKLDILTSEKPLDKCLAFILATELLYGKKTLPGESKPVKTILKYHRKLTDVIDTKNVSVPSSSVKNPRYVRVNLMKTTLELTLTHFKREGYILKPTSDNYQEFIEHIKCLNEFEFMLDFHMPKYLLVFPVKTQFYNHPLYQDGSLVLQDKASCLSVEALAPPNGCTLLDSCAAPGMKTCQAVVSVCGPNKEGCVIAVERNQKRYKVLEKLLYRHCGDLKCTGNLKIIHSDFLQLKPENFPEVQYMIVDPTCSGSGSEENQQFNKSKEERLSKLSNLQSIILQHAFKFPGLKKLAYSTCSINVEENENVVQDVLKHIGCAIIMERISTDRSYAPLDSQ